MMLLEMAADTCPSRVAFHDAQSDQKISYGGLLKAASAKAQFFKDSGIAHCAILDVSNLTIPVALFASAWAGIPYVPMNYRLTNDEISRLLQRIDPAMLITNEELAESIPRHDGLIVHHRTSFQAAHAKEENEPGSWSMDPDAVCTLLFTSGTTGAPKAAIIRQRHLVAYILQTIEFMSADEEEAVLVSVPPYHIAGIASVISSVYACRRVIQLAQFSPEAWLETAVEHGVTSAFVVPTMLKRIVEYLGDTTSEPLPLLTSLSYGGGKMPLPVIRRAMELFPNTEFTNAYGLTETSSTITVLGPNEHRLAAASDDPKAQKRLASAGIAVPGVEISIRDDDGNNLCVHERGEIFVRGEQISGEYVGQETQVDADGWFRTHDTGYVDDAGYLYLEGRADDVIVRGGENLSPGEIEDVLIEHPAVADVAVIGVPSVEWGEAVAAVIVANKEVSAIELQELIRRRLRSSRVPERIEFWPELPYNDTGKLLRREIRRRVFN